MKLFHYYYSHKIQELPVNDAFIHQLASRLFIEETSSIPSNLIKNLIHYFNIMSNRHRIVLSSFVGSTLILSAVLISPLGARATSYLQQLFRNSDGSLKSEVAIPLEDMNTLQSDSDFKAWTIQQTSQGKVLVPSDGSEPIPCEESETEQQCLQRVIAK